uniref:Uncharacterized protein n=1 Tax=Rhizophora mucronata TaxID=61149 RepID=A0A2P2MBB7_RHIMU
MIALHFQPNDILFKFLQFTEIMVSVLDVSYS